MEQASYRHEESTLASKVVYKTHAESAGLAAVFTANTSDASTHQRLLKTLYAKVPTLADDRWGGYSFFVPTPSSTNASEWTYTSTLLMYRANATNDEVVGGLNTTMTGLLANLTSIAGANSSKAQYFALPSFASALSVFSTLLSEAGSEGSSEGSQDSASSLLFSIAEPISVYSINRFFSQDVLSKEASLDRMAEVALSSIITGK